MNRIHYGSIQILIRITDQDPDPEIKNLRQNIISVTLLQLFHFYIETVHFFCLFIVKLGPGSESAPWLNLIRIETKEWWYLNSLTAVSRKKNRIIRVNNVVLNLLKINPPPPQMHKTLQSRHTMKPAPFYSYTDKNILVEHWNFNEYSSISRRRESHIPFRYQQFITLTPTPSMNIHLSLN